jgi:hypothetical protein
MPVLPATYLAIGGAGRVHLKPDLDLRRTGMDGLVVVDLAQAARRFRRIVPDPNGPFNLRQVAMLCGLTRRQVQVWVERGVIAPQHGQRGHGCLLRFTRGRFRRGSLREPTTAGCEVAHAGERV